MTYGTILVAARGEARRTEALEMRCNAKEIPDPLGTEKPVGWWIAGLCTVSGSASAGTPDGVITPVRMQGTVAIAVTPEWLLGIFSTNSTADPAIWFSWSIPQLRIETAGSQGVFKKRAAQITVHGLDATLVLSDVNRLYRNIIKYQTGQENSFLDAVAATA